ncbi:membrane protein [Beggiatoa sp. PS]|nr:membrane protein [Beggiatoa sp. PS]
MNGFLLITFSVHDIFPIIILIQSLSFFSLNNSSGVMISGVDKPRRPLMTRICLFLICIGQMIAIPC